MGSIKYEKLLTERFNEAQYSWKDFFFVAVAALLVMGSVRQGYNAPETILLLAYAYTVLVHTVVFVRLPKLVMSWR